MAATADAFRAFFFPPGATVHHKPVGVRRVLPRGGWSALEGPKPVEVNLRYDRSGAKMDLFPIFLKLSGRRCLVIGGGNLAESKIESLRAAHAHVTVIAPTARQRILDMAAAGEVVYHQRVYRQGDVQGYFLVVTATDEGAVN